LPNEEVAKAIDTFKPIHVDDAQYALLTRALRPEIAPVPEARQADAPGLNQPAAADTATQPRADHPLGTPIV
jgi:hypothetical protein